MEIKSRFTGFCQRVKKEVVAGWAINGADPTDRVVVFAFIDNKQVTELLCDQPREDIQQQIHFLRSDIGFQFIIPDIFRDGKNHTLSFKFIDGAYMSIMDHTDPDKRLLFLTFMLPKVEKKVEYVSYIDGWKNGLINGWVIKRDLKTQKYTGNCEIMVMMNGSHLKTIQASRYRGDVASAIGGDAYCGFSVFVPLALRSNKNSIFRLFIMPEQIEIQGSPYETSLIDDLLQRQILTISDSLDTLYKEIISLRNQVKKLVACPEFFLDEYALWAKEYYALLPSKLELLRLQNHSDDMPLISVICPVYKPELKFFQEAVESVRNQTYHNWELILVDDGGKSQEIQKEIKRFVALDMRIKSVVLKENKGISEATNAGLKKATGEWIAFFDHDDLLVAQALEIMLYSAQINQAQVMYSDEDKIDVKSVLSDPNFKPDFNYRYLLGSNYMCHFVMVHADTVKKVGYLRSKYDGAQDHDFLLRLTESVPYNQFHHVPELLYHWRKTKNSTAESTDNKYYAIEAGIACVNDHLQRIKKPAKVSSMNKTTIYNVVWDKAATATVTIIIPFKDQIKTTQECVDRILKKTSYKNYTILLVDNGSREVEAAGFIKTYTKNNQVKVLLVDEEFNFARLNNLAAKQAKSDFYLFLNNDVFIEDKTWLTYLVNEAVLFDDVAVVGGKLLYPNGKVQHGGVIVGPGVVAEHMNRGLNDDDYGYSARSLLSQDLSAVTAAMMLVRASIFHELGGFDEKNLKIAYNDVDFCLKVREAGYRIILSTNCKAVHHESLSRGSDDHPEHQARFAYEVEYMNTYWGDKQIYKNDPAYSPHFLVKPQLFYELSDPNKTEVFEA